MFHGAPGSSPRTARAYLAEHARRVAGLGSVVFNASWGHEPGGAGTPTCEALVTWEGSWLLSVDCPDPDGAHAADPRIMGA